MLGLVQLVVGSSLRHLSNKFSLEARFPYLPSFGIKSD